MVSIDTIGGIIFYHPRFDKIEFYTKNTPSESDPSITFCCTASFSNHRLLAYEKDNVSGPYVSSDNGYCDGYNAINYPIAFVYMDNKWSFHRDSIDLIMKICAERNGVAFTQMDVFPSNISSEGDDLTKNSCFQSCKKGSRLTLRRQKHRYRALCEKNYELFIAESVSSCTYNEFVSSLLNNGIEHAIYLDCGLGWSYGWYRINSESAKLLHWLKPPYISNWLVFKKS